MCELSHVKYREENDFNCETVFDSIIHLTVCTAHHDIVQAILQ